MGVKISPDWALLNKINWIKIRVYLRKEKEIIIIELIIIFDFWVKNSLENSSFFPFGDASIIVWDVCTIVCKGCERFYLFSISKYSISSFLSCGIVDRGPRRRPNSSLGFRGLGPGWVLSIGVLFWKIFRLIIFVDWNILLFDFAIFNIFLWLLFIVEWIYLEKFGLFWWGFFLLFLIFHHGFWSFDYVFDII